MSEREGPEADRIYCRRCRRYLPRHEFARISDDVEPGTEPTPYETIESLTIWKHKPCNKQVFTPALQRQ